jgi:hypothetical protein
MDSEQENLIYHFIKHYKLLGIPQKNWKIVVHYKIGCENSIILLNKNDIEYEIVNEYTSDLKKEKVNDFILSIKNGWLVYPDLDEFFEYNQKLEIIIDECEKKHIELIKGKRIERFSKDFELIPITKNQNIFDTFNISIDCNRINHETNQSNVNVMLVKITNDKKPIYVNSHSLENEESYSKYNKDLIINHFKWSFYVINCLRYKFLKYLEKKEYYKALYYKNLYFMIKKRDDKYYVNMLSQLIL